MKKHIATGLNLNMILIAISMNLAIRLKGLLQGTNDRMRGSYSNRKNEKFKH